MDENKTNIEETKADIEKPKTNSDECQINNEEFLKTVEKAVGKDVSLEVEFR